MKFKTIKKIGVAATISALSIFLLTSQISTSCTQPNLKPKTTTQEIISIKEKRIPYKINVYGLTVLLGGIKLWSGNTNLYIAEIETKEKKESILNIEQAHEEFFRGLKTKKVEIKNSPENSYEEYSYNYTEKKESKEHQKSKNSLEEKIHKEAQIRVYNDRAEILTKDERGNFTKTIKKGKYDSLYFLFQTLMQKDHKIGESYDFTVLYGDASVYDINAKVEAERKIRGEKIYMIRIKAKQPGIKFFENDILFWIGEEGKIIKIGQYNLIERFEMVISK